MADAMKMMTRNGGAGMARMAQMLGIGGGGGGMDRLKNLGGGKMAEPDPEQLRQQLEKLQSGLGGAGSPTGLPGLGGGPALPPGFNPFKK
jgi:signal recognition particle subunit SRP54